MQDLTYFAQTYNACPYGSGNFNSQTNTGTTACAGTTTSSSDLVNTGFIVLVVVVAAALLLFAALLVRFIRRPTKPASPQKPGAPTPAIRA